MEGGAKGAPSSGEGGGPATGGAVPPMKPNGAPARVVGPPQSEGVGGLVKGGAGDAAMPQGHRGVEAGGIPRGGQAVPAERIPQGGSVLELPRQEEVDELSEVSFVIRIVLVVVAVAAAAS